MNNTSLYEKIFGVLALISCLILIQSLLSMTLFDHRLIDLNQAGLFILWTIVSIVQYYWYKIKNIQLP